jgi:hypothetical protein
VAAALPNACSRGVKPAEHLPNLYGSLRQPRPMQRALPVFAVLLMVLAGCIVTVDEPEVERRAAHDGSHPGLVVEGTRESRSGRHAVVVHATNAGERTYHVSSICHPVFLDHVESSKGARVWPQPPIFCEAFGTRPFTPGETLTHRSWWNGTTASGGSAKGTYTWVVTFHAGEEESRALQPILQVAFNVRAV